MSTIHEDGNGFVQYTKGAPDEVLKKCVSIETDGQIVPLTEDMKDAILADNKRMAGKALRVLCAAYKKYSTLPHFEPATLENELIFIGE
jgi:Ca2+-transporting ATPase